MNLLVGIVSTLLLIYLVIKVHKITEDSKKIMGKQEDFNVQIERANTALADLGTKIADEGQQIRDFIEANPAVDTSALEDVVANLEGIGSSVEGIFTAPSTEAAGSGEAGGDASTGTAGNNPTSGGSGGDATGGPVDAGTGEQVPASSDGVDPFADDE